MLGWCQSNPSNWQIFFETVGRSGNQAGPSNAAVYFGQLGRSTADPVNEEKQRLELQRSLVICDSCFAIRLLQCAALDGHQLGISECAL
jgi:hypothetical protein